MTKVFMETRKVQKAGKGSYTLNLPLWWVKENKLEKGDKIDILRDKSGKLILNCNDLKSDVVWSIDGEDEGSISSNNA